MYIKYIIDAYNMRASGTRRYYYCFLPTIIPAGRACSGDVDVRVKSYCKYLDLKFILLSR